MKSMQKKLSGDREQYPFPVQFKEAYLGLAAPMNPTRCQKSALELSISTATSPLESGLHIYAHVKVQHTKVHPLKRRLSSAAFKSKTGSVGSGSLVILSETLALELLNHL